MNISKLAKKCDVSTDTIRYYEKKGLMKSPLRQDNGYRLYCEIDLVRLQFIRTAKKLGFTLEEIRIFLPEIQDNQLYKKDLENKLQQKVIQIDKKITDLQHLKVDIVNTLQLLKCNTDTPLNLNQLID
ncbi:MULTISPECIES: MerR family transcriptional regulator [unclassified Acinetobacter]|uniref:MerR family transcriptional regulator n=1 Tax=unclassified Acinetobacter TaxID=196816 RepID=UPI00293501F1|nr:MULTISPECIES: MerR family transcriptional regulator [unclassified Acinetobacter]WOE32676.1 MerR family transcriptional regulator [Acinetobacter sp. SAAs470]WOE38152.1 MerR family transcriptional regulator [Acinetobacter sp. SAAs474]